MIGRTNVGGGSARINIANYTVLPASGRDNQIALINSTEINDVYCQPTVPSDPTQGDVWIVVATTGTAYLQFGNIRFYITSIRQYDNNAWTYIGEWYVWQSGDWITGRLTLIDNGQFTGQAGITFASRMWAKSGRTLAGSATVTQEATCVQLDYYNTKSTSDTNGYGGMCSSTFDAGTYSIIHIESRSKWAGSNDAAQRIDIMINNYNVTNPDVNAIAYYTLKSNPTSSNTWYYADVDVPITYTTGEFCVYLGALTLYYNRHHYTEVFNLYLE